VEGNWTSFFGVIPLASVTSAIEFLIRFGIVCALAVVLGWPSYHGGMAGYQWFYGQDRKFRHSQKVQNDNCDWITPQQVNNTKLSKYFNKES
jgi:hypothetical protein